MLKCRPGPPPVPVRWTRSHKGEPGELWVFLCSKGWQYAEVKDEEILRIAGWLNEHPTATEFELLLGDGPVKQVMRVEDYAMPFFRAVIIAVAEEIKAKAVPVAEVPEEVPHGESHG